MRYANLQLLSDGQTHINRIIIRNSTSEIQLTHHLSENLTSGTT